MSLFNIMMKREQLFHRLIQTGLVYKALQFYIIRVKGTVSEISSDPPFVDWRVRFTSFSFKPLSDQGCPTRPYYSTQTYQTWELLVFCKLLNFSEIIYTFIFQKSLKISIIFDLFTLDVICSVFISCVEFKCINIVQSYFYSIYALFER